MAQIAACITSANQGLSFLANGIRAPKSVGSMTSCVASALAAHAPCPSPSEVEAVFHAPLSLFVDGGASHTYQDITWEQHAYRIHSFDHAGFKIWGLTAGILIQVQSWGSWEGTKHKFGCNLGMRGEGSKRLHTGAMLR
eukprot:1158805-Pelagomonas_calceolata.AAC.4